MHTILIVDGSSLFLKQIKTRMKSYRHQLNLMTANDSETALKLLQQTELSYFITDMDVCPQNGLILLDQMQLQFPQIPCLLMHNRESRELEQRLDQRNIGYLVKPFRIERLVDLIFSSLKSMQSEGFLQGIAVTSFINMIELEQMSCVCEVKTAKGNRGLFYLFNGLIYDAIYEDLQGEEAAIEMLMLHNASITIQKKMTTPVTCRVNKGILALSVEAMKRRDDQNSNKRS